MGNNTSQHKSTKFERVFDELADVRDRLTRVEVHEESEQKKLDEVDAKLDVVTCQLHEIIGRDAVRSSIAGVIGAVISGILTYFFTIVKGS